MTGFVKTAAGETFTLPPAISYEFHHTAGVPCDSFSFLAPWDKGGDILCAHWSEFYAQQDGRIVFRGVIDECISAISAKGATVELCGRGMAARLLDNEALGQDYAVAGMEDILKDHVLPYGIKVKTAAQVAPVNRFSITTGQSEWSVLYQFCCYHAGITPRFDGDGMLVIAPFDDKNVILIDDSVPVISMQCRDKRYGVLSEIWVREAYKKTVMKMRDGAFCQDGGKRRQIITMPRKSDYKTRRYSGEFQLKQAKKEQISLDIQVAVPFFAQPGDLVQVEKSAWGRNGIYRVVTAKTSCDDGGEKTHLHLRAKDAMI